MAMKKIYVSVHPNGWRTFRTQGSLKTSVNTPRNDGERSPTYLQTVAWLFIRLFRIAPNDAATWEEALKKGLPKALKFIPGLQPKSKKRR